MFELAVTTDTNKPRYITPREQFRYKRRQWTMSFSLILFRLIKSTFVLLLLIFTSQAKKQEEQTLEVDRVRSV